MSLISSLVIGLSAKTDTLQKDFSKADQITGNWVSGLTSKLKGLGPMIAGVAAGVAGFAAIGAGIKGALDRVDELGASADKIGVTTEALSALQFAAGQSDVEIGTLQGGLQKLTTNLGQAVNGSTEAAKGFQALGLNAADLANAGTTEAFAQIAEKISAIQNPAQQSAAAVAIFGRSGAELLPLLKQGGDGIDQLTARAEELGLVMSQDQVDGIKKANDAIDELGAAWDGVFNQLAAVVAPILTSIFKGFTWLVSGIRKVVGGIYDAVVFVLEGVTQVVIDAYNAVVTTFGGDAISNPFSKSFEEVAKSSNTATDTVSNFVVEMETANKKADDLAKKMEEVATKTENLTKDWQTQSQTMGMSSEQLAVFKREQEIASLKAAGATQEQIAQLENLNKKLTEQEAALKRQNELKVFDDMAAGWQQQIDTIGLAGRELDIYKAKMAGATDEQIKQLEDLNTKLKEQEDLAALKDDGKALAESLKTPLEKFEAEQEKLKKMLAAGAIDSQTFDRANAKAFADLDSASGQTNLNNGPATQFAGAANMGSVEAMQILNSAANQTGGISTDPMQRLAEIQTKELSESQKQTRLLQQLAGGTNSTSGETIL